ncbi:MAG: tripartite tricarboxylate transporter substrate binding protein [Betaproteobacteria bacterium]|nr:MAG: tripartite tricarboxylate transporter substrate binding protein [Betaproteobacteria bacterium]
MKRVIAMLAAIGPALGAAAPAYAQTYPERPIRLIVPFSPGGTSDLMGRVVGQRLGELLGTTVVVDNRGGAGGTLGAALAAQAAPDGYTLLVPHVGLAVNETLYAKKPYNALKDLTPISLLGETPNAVVVTNALPAKSMNELLGLARKQQGKLTCSSAGVGSAAHLAMALLEYSANVKFTHVPFKGGGPSMIAVIAGQVDFSIPAYPTAVPHIKSGKLRIIAVTGAKREPTVPDVPTIAEAAVPGYEFGIWFSMFAPAGTPKPIVARLNQEVVKALAAPDMRQKLAQTGVNVETSTPEQLGKHLQAEVAKWAKVIKAAGIPIN